MDHLASGKIRKKTKTKREKSVRKEKHETNIYVVSTAEPLAYLKIPVPPTIATSLAFRRVGFLPRMLRVLPL